MSVNLSEIEKNNRFARDVDKGLSAKRKYVPPKYFYDKIGSRLFEKICDQPEYYPTRTETRILSTHMDTIIKLIGDHRKSLNIIELGSGSSIKTKLLLKNFLSKRRIHYFPIDISQSILDISVKHLISEFNNLQCTGICSEYIEGLKRINDLIFDSPNFSYQKLIIFFGSTIGNFEPNQAQTFMTNIKKQMTNQDMMLVGFDLQKDQRTMEKAYNDAAGITAKFNLNILARINRELGGRFNVKSYYHKSFYNQSANRIEMHIVSKHDQEVEIKLLDKIFSFHAEESIHTENSYKFSLDEITTLATKSGFKIVTNFTDLGGRFCLSCLR